MVVGQRPTTGDLRGDARYCCLNQNGQNLRIYRMPDGNDFLIGHCVGVRCCFSFGCGFRLCPIVPDEMRAGSERAESGLVYLKEDSPNGCWSEDTTAANAREG